MAVFCEFINVIIPISKIDEVYKGGFNKFKADNKEMFKGRYWHDECLFRDGAMNRVDSANIRDYWESKGLVGFVEDEKGNYWKDFCVISVPFGLTNPCNWVEFDNETCSAFFKGENRGEVIAGANR